MHATTAGSTPEKQNCCIIMIFGSKRTQQDEKVWFIRKVILNLPQIKLSRTKSLENE